MSESVDRKNPPDECDLVMKGGITSGIVYPPAVLELARQYRFRSVGGTSAGAIAAALVSAAEYDRQGTGLEKLEELNTQLSQPGFLLSLFQPTAASQPLLETIMAGASAKAEFTSAAQAKGSPLARGLKLLGLAAGVARSGNPAVQAPGTAWGRSGAIYAGVGAGTVAFLGALLTVVLLLLLTGSNKWGLAVGLSAAVGFGVAALFTGLLSETAQQAGVVAAAGKELLRILNQVLPAQGFGICQGLAAPGADGSKPALTEWLTRSINEVAGLDPAGPPLTFGLLQQKGICAAMVTSNLSLGEPFTLPFESHQFIFHAAEMEQYFPPQVVKHLREHAHQDERVTLPDGYHFLPAAADLPLVLATRMSLSFPVLISAVPLYTVAATAFARPRVGKKAQVQKEDLRRNVFSDGGICSNFPIHFFDGWLPSRPTFGINLTAWPKEAFERGKEELKAARMTASPADEAMEEMLDADHQAPDPAKLRADAEYDRQGVVLPAANRPPQAEWQEISGLLPFLGSIFSTSQNYRDNTQSRLPSYRERIVQVRLKASEGGLNLNMSPDQIQVIKNRGQVAGKVLLDDFDFDHHTWVRFLVLMSELEAHARAIQRNQINLKEVVEKQRAMYALGKGARYPYPRDPEWCERAIQNLVPLEALLEHWTDLDLFQTQCPSPHPVLRMTPRV